MTETAYFGIYFIFAFLIEAITLKIGKRYSSKLQNIMYIYTIFVICFGWVLIKL